MDEHTLHASEVAVGHHLLYLDTRTTDCLGKYHAHAHRIPCAPVCELDPLDTGHPFFRGHYSLLYRNPHHLRPDHVYPFVRRSPGRPRSMVRLTGGAQWPGPTFRRTGTRAA